MELGLTLALLAAGVALTGYCRWYEARPRELGEVRLLPSTLLMALGLLMGLVALAHLVSLVTGVPFAGRIKV
jgi:uncharacterized membrane protein YidH (DUF202 family)